MVREAEKKPPHHVLFHRALLALIPAGGFTLAAYNNDFSWYFVVPAALLWGVGIWYLKHGSDRWNDDAH